MLGDSHREGFAPLHVPHTIIGRGFQTANCFKLYRERLAIACAGGGASWTCSDPTHADAEARSLALEKRLLFLSNGSEKKMTDYDDYRPTLSVIQDAIDKAQKNPNLDKPAPSDDYIAWVVLQELRRAGWMVSRNPDADRSPIHPR